MKNRVWKYLMSGLFAVLTSLAYADAHAGVFSSQGDSSKIAGFRASRILSSYPDRKFPPPDYWEMVGDEMAGGFQGYYPGGVWIVSLYLSSPEGYTMLNFPYSGESIPWIYFKNTDENERYLDHFDTTGVRVWLQVEPGGADIDTLIHIVLNRYKHHPSVLGFGIDVEWYQTYDYSGGRKVSNAEAQRWEEKVKAVNPEYTLFLKHYSQSWMPPSYRGDVIFVDDSQNFTWSSTPFNTMVNEFKAWGQKFSPNPVCFQYGYPADRSWWSKYDDPAHTIGNALVTNIPNCRGLFWVDFTVTEVFPPTGIEEDMGIPQAFMLEQNYPNPFNSSTAVRYRLPASGRVDLCIYNVIGQKIVTLLSDEQPAGEYVVHWNASGYPSGVYYVQLTAKVRQENVASRTLKMILIN